MVIGLDAREKEGKHQHLGAFIRCCSVLALPVQGGRRWCIATACGVYL